MKFLLCLVLCFAAAQAGLIGGVPSALTYSSGIAPLSYGYNSPLAYSAYARYPSTYTAGFAAPTVYSSAGLDLGVGLGLGLGGPLVRSAYAAPAVYSTPSVYSTLLKK